MLNYSDLKVKIKDMKEIHIAALEHIGEYEGDGQVFDNMLDKILEWAVPEKLFDFPEKTKIISLYSQDKEEKKLIFGITIKDTVKTPKNINKVKVDSGKHAVARFELHPEEFGLAWEFIYRWIGENGYTPEGKPAYEIQHNDSCEHPEKKHIVDICVPIIMTEG